MLALDTFKTVIASTPLISIDLIVRNKHQQVLLGRRINKPAQECWFVPGGRILKDEPIGNAFKRLLKAEIGMDEVKINTHRSIFNGIYQHFYTDNVTGSDVSTHYIVLAYEIEVECSLDFLPKDQHSNYKWLSEQSILIDDSVHKHTKWYFQKGKNADASFSNEN
ncbi:MAG: colanic acid biosynthesis protein WcaH [Oleispira sp.]|jgi:colanic acid biosynthesis protein WcaH